MLLRLTTLSVALCFAVRSALAYTTDTQRGPLWLPDRSHYKEGVFDYCRGGDEYSIVHADLKRGGYRYLVFTTSGWSRGTPSDRGRCGCGWETQLNFVILKGKRLIQHERVDIESCWVAVDGSHLEWKDNKLSFGSWTQDGEYEAIFDPETPVKGFQIISGPESAVTRYKAEQGAAANP